MKGFTLLELIVVMGLIGIVTGIVFTGVRAGEESLLLDRAANSLAQDVRLAMDYALQVQPDPGTCPPPPSTGPPQPNHPTVLKGFGIRFDTNVNTYDIYANCEKKIGSGVGAGNTYHFVVPLLELRLEEGVEISEIRFANNTVYPGTRIVFTPPDPTTRITNNENHVQGQVSTSRVDVTLALESDAAKTRTVKITNKGVIEVQ